MDMDAFFAAIEQRDNPHLAGRPVIIGADPRGGLGRGVVSTCSYEARRFGVHSAQPISLAHQLCPQAVFLPVDGKKYSRVSDVIFNLLYDFTPDIEPISIDEAFLDMTGSVHFYKSPHEMCLKIKEEIRKKINLTASLGMAPNKMIAKIASDLGKPDGLLEVKPDEVLKFLWPLPIEKLWGVGPKTKQLLNAREILCVGDLAQIPLQKLSEEFGEHGRHLYELSHGIDDREVQVNEEIKSIGHEHTFERDTDDRSAIESVLLSLSEQVSRRLRKNNLKGRTLTVKIRLKGFTTYSRAHTFSERTNFVENIFSQAKEIFNTFYKKGMMIRLIGVRMTQFDDSYVQDSLFDDVKEQKKEKIHHVVDIIKDKFGEHAIHRGEG